MRANLYHHGMHLPSELTDGETRDIGIAAACVCVSLQVKTRNRRRTRKKRLRNRVSWTRKETMRKSRMKGRQTEEQDVVGEEETGVRKRMGCTRKKKTKTVNIEKEVNVEDGEKNEGRG